MSRTYRRKNSKRLKSHLITLPYRKDIGEYVSEQDKYYISWMMKRNQCTDVKLHNRKETAWFHSDNHSGHWNAPWYFRNMLNRRLRREEDHELHKIVKLPEYEDLSPLFFQNAGWYFW